jgi:hypothetical protein
VLERVQQIESLAHSNPEAVRALTIAIQRDVALTIAALRSVQAWMEAAKRGKEGEA